MSYNTTNYMLIERIMYELSVMSKRNVTVTELAQRLEVHERTIKRDIAFIRDRLGIEIICVGKGMGYRTKDNISIPKPVGM